MTQLYQKVIQDMNADLGRIPEFLPLVQKMGVPEDVTQWFKSGFGQNYYQAFLAARNGEFNQVNQFAEIAPKIIQKLETALNDRAALNGKLPPSMVDTQGTLNLDAINVLRKAAVPTADRALVKTDPRWAILKQTLKEKFDADLGDSVFELKHSVDLIQAALGPPLLRLPDEQLQLLSGDGGYLVVIDFKDVGAENIRQLLMAANHISDGLDACMEEALIGWDRATAWLNHRQQTLVGILKAVLGEDAAVKISGDDGMFVLKEYDPAVIQKITQALAKSEFPDMVRFSGIDRTRFTEESEIQVAVEPGEAFEKDFRSKFCKNATRDICAGLSIFAHKEESGFIAFMSSAHPLRAAQQRAIRNLVEEMGGSLQLTSAR